MIIRNRIFILLLLLNSLIQVIHSNDDDEQTCSSEQDDSCSEYPDNQQSLPKIQSHFVGHETNVKLFDGRNVVQRQLSERPLMFRKK
jgi:hypothetical protein